MENKTTLPTLTWTIGWKYYDGKQNQNFYFHFDLLPEIIATVTMFYDNNIRKNFKTLVKLHVFVFYVTFVIMKLLAILFINKLFARIKVFKKL